MGMDWHSSGITTSVLGALKRGLTPVQHELGIYVCGGKGAQFRKTPVELGQRLAARKAELMSSSSSAPSRTNTRGAAAREDRP